MIINSSNPLQRNILTYKCYYMTMAQIITDFAKKGYTNPAEEAVKVVTAYHDLVAKKNKNNYNKDYNEAFARIDTSIKKSPIRFFIRWAQEVLMPQIPLFKILIISMRRLI